jgi:hypothetical protein
MTTLTTPNVSVRSWGWLNEYGDRCEHDKAIHRLWVVDNLRVDGHLGFLALPIDCDGGIILACAELLAERLS